MITAKDAIQSLYKSVRGTYMQRTFSTTSRQFVPDLLLQRPSKQFVPDPLLVPLSDLGPQDFQSSAMTALAKETILAPNDGIEPPN
jgi:hypothetical protein